MDSAVLGALKVVRNRNCLEAKVVWDVMLSVTSESHSRKLFMIPRRFSYLACGWSGRRERVYLVQGSMASRPTRLAHRWNAKGGLGLADLPSQHDSRAFAHERGSIERADTCYLS